MTLALHGLGGFFIFVTFFLFDDKVIGNNTLQMSQPPSTNPSQALLLGLLMAEQAR